MSKRTSTAVDVLFVISVISVVMSLVAFAAGNQHWQLYSAEAACFALLLAVLLCVYPGGGR